MYQIEVKLNLARLEFNPGAGWDVTIHVDPMERARGGSHPKDKSNRAARAIKELRALGVEIGAHDTYGAVDVVANHPEHGLRLIEVEGTSRKQLEQALYSCLGQLLLIMDRWGPKIRYGVAVPDNLRWRRQLAKLPPQLTYRLDLELYLVGPDAITKYEPGEPVNVPSR